MAVFKPVTLTGLLYEELILVQSTSQTTRKSEGPHYTNDTSLTMRFGRVSLSVCPFYGLPL